MAIFNSDDRFLKWKYRISELYLVYPNQEPVPLPNERLVSMAITHDYENNVFPLFRIELVLESSRFYEILRNKDAMQFKIRIQKYYTEFGKKEKSLYRDFINDTFDLILDDDGFDVDQELKREEAKKDYTKKKKSDINELFEVDNKLEFFLFKSATIQATRKTVNKVLYGATVTDGIAYVATASGLLNLLMAPADNHRIIPELIIPPMHAVNALLFLDCYYGIYKTGSMIYCDFDRNYIIPYEARCRAWSTNEKKECSIMIPNRSSTFSSEICTVERTDQNTKINYIVGENSGITIRNESITYDILAGNDIETVNSYDGSVENGNSSTITKYTSSERRITNMTENPYFTDIYTAQTSAKSVVMELGLGDYDVSYIKPNQVYRVIFEDTALTKKYRGYFKLVQANHVFVKDGADFRVVSTVTVKSVKK